MNAAIIPEETKVGTGRVLAREVHHKRHAHGLGVRGGKRTGLSEPKTLFAALDLSESRECPRFINQSQNTNGTCVETAFIFAPNADCAYWQRGGPVFTGRKELAPVLLADTYCEILAILRGESGPKPALPPMAMIRFQFWPASARPPWSSLWSHL